MPDALSSSDPLKELKADLTEQFKQGDRRVTDALTRKMDALSAKSETQHTSLMAEVTKIAAWMTASDEAKAVLDKQTKEAERLKAEQAQKEIWLAEQAALTAAEAKVKEDALAAATLAQAVKDAADLKAKHDRWAPYVTATLGVSAAVVSGSVFYVLNNLNSLRWALPSQLISGAVVLSILVAFALFKWSP